MGFIARKIKGLNERVDAVSQEPAQVLTIVDDRGTIIAPGIGLSAYVQIIYI